MNHLKKIIFRYSIFEALAYCLIAPLMVLLETRLCGIDIAFLQVLPISIASTIFFALSIVCYSVYYMVIRRGGNGVIGYYLGSKLLILLLTLGSILIYGIVAASNVVLFAINLMVLYLIHLLTSSLLYASVERNMKYK